MFPEDGAQPVVAETQPVQGLELVGVGVGDVREIGTEDDAVLQPGKTVQIALRHGGESVSEIRAHHRGVEKSPGIVHGKVCEGVVLRHAHVRDNQHQFQETWPAGDQRVQVR